MRMGHCSVCCLLLLEKLALPDISYCLRSTGEVSHSHLHRQKELMSRTVRLLIHERMRARMRTYARVRAHTHTYTRTRTHAHTHARTHTRTHTHTHTQTCARASTHTAHPSIFIPSSPPTPPLPLTHTHTHAATHTCKRARVVSSYARS